MHKPLAKSTTRSLTAIAISILCIIAFPVLSASADSSTPQVAYVISTCQQLQNMSNDVTGDYSLSANVDCTGFAFVPVGTSSAPFTGSLDEAGFSITGLATNSSTTTFGIFAYVSDATFSHMSYTTPATPTTTTTVPVPTSVAPQTRPTTTTAKTTSGTKSISHTAATVTTTTTTTTTVPPVTTPVALDVSASSSSGSQVRDLLTGSSLVINVTVAGKSIAVTASLKQLDTNDAIITFASTTHTFDVKVPLLGAVNVDLDGNGKNDTTIELTAIATDRATIRITPIISVSDKSAATKKNSHNLVHYVEIGIAIIALIILLSLMKGLLRRRKDKS